MKGKGREKGEEKETGRKEEWEAKEIAASWATQMEEYEGEERREEEGNTIIEVIMEETSQNWSRRNAPVGLCTWVFVQRPVGPM